MLSKIHSGRPAPEEMQGNMIQERQEREKNSVRKRKGKIRKEIERYCNRAKASMVWEVGGRPDIQGM